MCNHEDSAYKLHVLYMDIVAIQLLLACESAGFAIGASHSSRQ